MTARAGDPARFRTLAELEAAFEALPPVPQGLSRLALMVVRGANGHRETPASALLTPERGLPGDGWERKTPTNPDAQIAVMQRDIAELIANGQPLALFGDNLFLDLDLSAANLPAGTPIAIGAARLVVTPKAHNGCGKFSARFGADALRFISAPERRPRNLRGIYLRVVHAGEARVGDPVIVG